MVSVFLFQNHYIMCTILEAGSYSRPVVGNPGPDPFFVDQVKVTLSQLDSDDADLEIACNERLSFSAFLYENTKSYYCHFDVSVATGLGVIL